MHSFRSVAWPLHDSSVSRRKKRKIIFQFNDKKNIRFSIFPDITLPVYCILILNPLMHNVLMLSVTTSYRRFIIATITRNPQNVSPQLEWRKYEWENNGLMNNFYTIFDVNDDKRSFARWSKYYSTWQSKLYHEFTFSGNTLKQQDFCDNHANIVALIMSDREWWTLWMLELFAEWVDIHDTLTSLVFVQLFFVLRKRLRDTFTQLLISQKVESSGTIHD